MKYTGTAVVLLMSVAFMTRAQEAPRGVYPVQWDNWSFNWQIDQRRGVVLTDVRFGDRSVLKSASVAEVFVPYNSGTPRVQDQREHPFGVNMVPLNPGTDCLPGGTCHALGFDGEPVARRAAVMIHEEDPSPIYFGDLGRARAKTLVLWSAYELGDYVYIVQWCFRADGMITPRIGMTGRLAYFGGDDTNSATVARGRRALAHVHNVVFCLDFDVDGQANTVEEFNYEVIDNGPGERAETSWTPIDTETGRSLNPASFRTWRVVSTASQNAAGQPRSYEVIPGGTGIFRGGSNETFAHNDLWITRYDDAEVSGPTLLADGLAGSVNDEPVAGEDVVLWYMLSVHHQPKSEDWPAMPISWHEFRIAPRDFLDASPVMPRQGAER